MIGSQRWIPTPGFVAFLPVRAGAHDRFKPQPWEQIIGVLRQMGHIDEARRLAIAKHRKMRAAGRYAGASAAWDLDYGTLVGYG